MTSPSDQGAAPAPRRVAVLLRSHLQGSEKAFELAGQLAAAKGWDLYFAVDETRGPVDVGPYRKVAHSLEACGAAGLFTARSRALHYFGDYPFYVSLPAIPDYDFYLMIEYDVGLAAKEGDYFSRLADRLTSPALSGLDLVATNLGPRRPEKAHRPHRYEALYHSLFPIIGLSRRAILYLHAQRLAEATLPPLSDGQPYVYCEYFVPTLMKAVTKFQCLSLNDVLPNSVDNPSFNAWNCRVLHHEARQPVTAELVHPVLDFPQYLGKSASVARKKRRIAEYIEELDFFRAANFDPGLIERTRAELAKAV